MDPQDAIADFRVSRLARRQGEAAGCFDAGEGGDGVGDADHLAFQVDERSARAAEVEAGVDLDEPAELCQRRRCFLLGGFFDDALDFVAPRFWLAGFGVIVRALWLSTEAIASVLTGGGFKNASQR